MIRVAQHAPRNRNEVMKALDAAGIPTRRGIMASHREAPYADPPTELPHTDAITDSSNSSGEFRYTKEIVDGSGCGVKRIGRGFVFVAAAVTLL